MSVPLPLATQDLPAVPSNRQRASARPDRWPPWLVEQLTELWCAERDDGKPRHTTAQIAAGLGITKKRVLDKAHRLGLPGRRSPIIRLQRGRL